MKNLRVEFLKLVKRHKKLSKSCKHLGRYNGYKKHSWNQCVHEDMNWGGITRNTDCELTNCPLILHGK